MRNLARLSDGSHLEQISQYEGEMLGLLNSYSVCVFFSHLPPVPALLNFRINNEE